MFTAILESKVKIKLFRGLESKFTEQFKRSTELIGPARQIVIIPHHNPDGDAIGSALGCYQILMEGGKFVDVISPNEYPDFLSWLPGSDKVTIYKDNEEQSHQILNNADLVIFVDFNCLDRIDPLSKFISELDKPKILIDHHPNPEDFADVIISDTSASSTSELVYHFIDGIGLDGLMNEETATCLMTGLMTDTGSFSFNSSNPDTFIIVAELLRYGINKDLIFSNVYNNFSENRMKLLGYCLNKKLKVYPEYRTGIISITKKELEQFNFEPGDTEGFVNYPLSVKGVIFSALFIERDDYIKISFRSKGSFPANKFSGAHFNGGGHLNAAGGNCSKNMTHCLELFESLLPTYQSQLLKSDN
jgi:phosphoesterase RecJ-like protein